MAREYKKWKNRSTNKNEQLLKIQHYIKVRLLHDRQSAASASPRIPSAGGVRPLFNQYSKTHKITMHQGNNSR